MVSSTVRYGIGVTREVGHDVAALGASRVALFTDATLAGLPPVRTALDSLSAQGVQVELFDKVRVEPTDQRWV